MTILYSQAPVTDQAVQDAIQYVKDNGYTHEQVRIFKTDTTVNVELKAVERN
jgi:hypothetical protein